LWNDGLLRVYPLLGIRKSHTEPSGEYGGWGMTKVLFLARKITNKQRRNLAVFEWNLLPLVSCPKHLKKLHETIDMSTSLATSLIMIWRSFINIFYLLLFTFSSIIDVLGRRSVRHLQRLRGHLENAYTSPKHMFCFYSRLTLGFLWHFTHFVTLYFYSCII
jgi:hypothetical protein